MKKYEGFISILLYLLFISGCSSKINTGSMEWIPSVTPPLQYETSDTSNTIEKSPSSDIIDTTVTEGEMDDVISVPGKEILYTSDELLRALNNTDGRELADMLWDNQRLSGLYSYSTEKITNHLTYYVSSSEGDDNNSGRTPDKPKKTLDMFNGVPNVNIMLKCGDTFQMKDTFWLGSSVIMAVYGEGTRPILDYYQPLEVLWTSVSDCHNVWSADLKGISGLYNGTGNKSDCNIGHLQINGECNWKRLVKGDDEEYSYPDYLAEQKSGAFAVDWENATLYLYSTVDPNQLEIYYPLPNHAMSVYHVVSSTVMGIELRGAGFHGISISEASNITVSNCYIHHIGGGLLRDRGPRYGNAVELWDSGRNLTITYNMAEWIYDTCYTNQGNAAGMIQQDLYFAGNIGRYCFWGIETWGDGSSTNEFRNIVYKDNVLMNACDVTNPNAVVYVNSKEQTLDEMGSYYSLYPAYLTYRGSAGTYPYNQMSLLNASNSRDRESLEIRNNLFWGTNRLLTIIKEAENGEVKFIFEDNQFYAEVPSEACVFRYTDKDNKRVFLKELKDKNNTSLVQTKDKISQSIKEQAEQELKKKLYLLATGVEE